MSDTPTETRIDATGSAPIWLAVVASFAFFFGRLWRFVSVNAVDVPYLDAWDVLVPFFSEQGVLAGALARHNGVMQGLGALLFALTSRLTGWDFRAQSFEIVLLLLVAAILALELRFRLYGRLTLADVVIAPLFFRMVQGAAIAIAPYAACGAFPLIFVLLGCRALLISDERLRLIVLFVVGFLAACTGFALFVPPVLMASLIIRAAFELGTGTRSAALSSARAAGVVAASLAPVAIMMGHRGVPPIPCPGGEPSPFDYMSFVVAMVNGSFGISERNLTSLLAGGLLLLVAATIFAVASVMRLSKRSEPYANELDAARRIVPLVLVSYSLIFSIAAAFARICAPGAALNSRYMPLMAPLALGLYFGLISWETNRRAVRVALTSLFVAITIVGAVRMAPYDSIAVETSVTGKRRWIACVKAGGRADDCSRRAQFEIYPSPGGTKLDDRIEFLRNRRLSLFRNDADSAAK